MTDKELSKLNRKELLEILLEISKENDSLRNEIADLKEQLKIKTEALEKNQSLDLLTNKIDDILNNRVIVNTITKEEKLIQNNKKEEKEKNEIVYDNDSYKTSLKKVNNDDYWDQLVNRLEDFIDDHHHLSHYINLESILENDDE